jgi:hypothetical protein
LVKDRWGRHRVDERSGDDGRRGPARHAAHPPGCDELGDAGDVIAHDWAPDAQGLHDRDRVRLIVRQGGDDTRLGQRGGHALAVCGGQVRDGRPLGYAKLAGESVKVTLISPAAEDQKVSFGDLTHDMRQRLDDSMMSLVSLQPAAGDNPARYGHRPSVRQR